MQLPEKEPAAPEPPPRSGRSGFQHVLVQRDFRLIWFAQLGAQLADKFLMFSLIILAYHVLRSSTAVATILLAYTIPAVAIAPLAGVFADRHDRKLIMVSTNVLRAVLIALIPLASLVPALRGDFVHLLVLTFAFSAVGQLFSPAEAAAIPSVLPKEALITANSMVLMTMVLTLVVGGALAPLVSRYDYYAPYWCAVLLFMAAGILIAFARIPKTAERDDAGERHPFHQVLVEVKEGFDVLGGSSLLMLSFLELSLAVLVVFMMFTLAPAYVDQVIGIGAQDSYVILVPATAGAILSGIVLGQAGRRLNKTALLVGGLIACGLTLLAMAAVPTAIRHAPELRGLARYVGGGFALLLGLEFGTLLIPALTYLMETTEDSVRGRIFALLFMVVNGVTAIPVLLAAALSDWFGINHVIAVLGVLLAGTGLGLLRYARRAFAAPPRPAPG